MIYKRRVVVYAPGVTKRLVDIDDDALEAAREALETRTIRDTVNSALRGTAALAARRRHLDRFRRDGLPDLRDADVARGAWR